MTNNTILHHVLEANAIKINGLLARLTTENSPNKINAQTATAGFYMRHIAEAQIMLSKMVFGTSTSLPYEKPFTLRVPNDDGRLYDVEETKNLMALGFETLKEVIEKTENWETVVETAPFGQLTLISGLSRILNHNAHHCGQVELAFKKPSNNA